MEASHNTEWSTFVERIFVAMVHSHIYWGSGIITQYCQNSRYYANLSLLYNITCYTAVLLTVHLPRGRELPNLFNGLFSSTLLLPPTGWGYCLMLHTQRCGYTTNKGYSHSYVLWAESHYTPSFIMTVGKHSKRTELYYVINSTLAAITLSLLFHFFLGGRLKMMDTEFRKCTPCPQAVCRPETTYTVQ